MENKEKDLKSILLDNHPVRPTNEELPQEELKPSEWVEIRLFISSTFVDTHSERDVLIKRVIPQLNSELKESYIRIVPVDLRWGVLKEESKDCFAIQSTCLNEIDNCRRTICLSPSPYNRQPPPYPTSFLSNRGVGLPTIHNNRRCIWCVSDLYKSVEYSIRAPMCLETSRLEVEVLETMGGKVRGGGCTYVVQKSQTYWYRRTIIYKRSSKRKVAHQEWFSPKDTIKCGSLYVASMSSVLSALNGQMKWKNCLTK